MKKPETVYEKLAFAMSYIKFLKKEIISLEKQLETTNEEFVFKSASIDNYYNNIHKQMNNLKAKVQKQKTTLTHYKVVLSKYKQYLPWIKRLQKEGLIEPELTTEI